MARAGKLGVKIRKANLKKIEQESQRIRTIYNQAWEKNWGFVPFTEAEMDHMAKEMKPLILPEAMLIAEIRDDPVGFVIGIPDINVALRHINGRLTCFGLPIGLLQILQNSDGPSHCPRSRGKVQARRHCRNACSRFDGRRFQTWIHRGIEHDARGQRHGQSLYRGDGRLEIQDLPDLRKIVGLTNDGTRFSKSP